MKKKKKYFNGGEVDLLNNPQAIGALGQVGLGGINLLDPTGNNGERSDVGAAFSGAIKGAQLGAYGGPPGIIAGTIIGAGVNLLGNKSAKDAAEEAENKARIEKLNQFQKKGENISQYYPTKGIAKYGMKLPNGGSLPYPTDGSDVDVLSSDAALYEGETHENGGIDLNVGIEIEDQEVIRDNEVYSNRLYPTDNIKNIAKNLNIRVDSNDTYANLVEKISRKKGKLEDSINSTRVGVSKSAELMIQKYDKLIDSLFEDQEKSKFENNNIKKEGIYMGGGKYIKSKSGKYPTGGTVPSNIRMPEGTSSDKLLASDNIRAAINRELIRNYPGVDLNVLDQNNKPVTPGIMDTPAVLAIRKGYSPEGISITKGYAEGGIYDLSEEELLAGTSLNDKLKSQLVGGNNLGSITDNKLGKSKLGVNDYLGDIYNLAGYINNSASINKLNTDINYEEIDSPRFNYVDRSKYNTNEIDKAYKTAVAGIKSSSVQDNQALASNLLAKKISGINEANFKEGLRRDSFTNNFNQRADRINTINASIKNQEEQQSFDNRNQKVALRQQAFDSLTRGLIGNQTQRDLMKLDQGRAILAAAKSGNTGVVERLLKKYPELSELLKIE